MENSYGVPTSPFLISPEKGQQLLSKRQPLLVKHWFRVIYRHSEGGQKWFHWMRFYPSVDAKHHAFHGQFKTQTEALKYIKEDQQRRNRSYMRGKEYQDLGGLGVEFQVSKTSKDQYFIYEEVTVTLSKKFVE